ncbi:MAG: HAMP domain-containing sensor histidine kinase [Pseudomonadota bacterium]
MAIAPDIPASLEASASSQPAPEAVGWANVSPWSATFRDKNLENEFQHDTAEDNAGYLKLTFAVAIILWCLFGVMDWLTLGGNRVAALTLRLGVVLPIAMVFFGLGSFREFYRRANLFIYLVCSLSGVTLAAITAIAEVPSSVYYVTGIIIVQMGTAFMFQTKFFVTLATVMTINVGYALVTILFAPLPYEEAVTVSFYLASSSLFVGMTRYVQEQSARKSFARKVLLAKYADQVAVLLRDSKAAEEAKKAFLSVISHELRTPLNAIIGFSDIIMNETLGQCDNAQYIDFAGAINNSGRSLLGIVNDIIYYTRAEAGKLELNESPTPLRRLISDVVDPMRGRAREKDINLNTDGTNHHDQLEICVDPRLVQHALKHIVENALKFAPNGTMVQISTKLDQREFSVVVSDEGPGIPEDMTDRIFNPFLRESGELTRRTEGMGIGLPFAKKIAELHSGDIVLGSAPEGGAAVRFTLPTEKISERKSKMAAG